METDYKLTSQNSKLDLYHYGVKDAYQLVYAWPLAGSTEHSSRSINALL